VSNIAGLSVRPRSSARTGSTAAGRVADWKSGSEADRPTDRPTDRADAGRTTLNARCLRRCSLFRVMYKVSHMRAFHCMFYILYLRLKEYKFSMRETEIRVLPKAQATFNF
jgi:hypothetical protein